jgi:hypothetical protein
MAEERWCIYIDMEGFSVLYDKENQIVLSLAEMMRAIYRIGTLAYPSEGDLFVDGCSDRRGVPFTRAESYRRLT